MKGTSVEVKVSRMFVVKVEGIELRLTEEQARQMVEKLSSILGVVKPEPNLVYTTVRGTKVYDEGDAYVIVYANGARAIVTKERASRIFSRAMDELKKRGDYMTIYELKRAIGDFSGSAYIILEYLLERSGSVLVEAKRRGKRYKVLPSGEA